MPENLINAVQRLQAELAQARARIVELTNEGWYSQRQRLEAELAQARAERDQAEERAEELWFNQADYEWALSDLRTERDSALAVLRSLARHNGEAQEFLATYGDAAPEDTA